MSLDSYDNLIVEIKEWTHRSDVDLKIPLFIQQAEAAMFSNATRNLTIRTLETISTQLTTSSLLDLPADYESARSIRLVLADGGGEIVYRTPTQLNRIVGTGRPQFFSIVGTQIELDRTPDSQYTLEIQYYKRATPLSAANQTNEVLTNHPNIYLFGALAAAFTFALDDEQAAKYRSLFLDFIKGANKADKKGRYGPAPAMRIEGGIV